MRTPPTLVALAAVVALVASHPALAGPSEPERLASAWATAIRKVNEAHAKDPGDRAEKDLAARVGKDARAALDRLLALAEGEDLAASLVHAGNAAADLDLAADFDRVRARVLEVAPDRGPALGLLVSRPRFVLRAVDGLDAAFAARFADVLDGVLDAYAEVFGFRHWSKVPGKKLRVRVHLVERIERPPHFAPQFPFHSEIDFPVADGAAFRSPTADGKFLFYGLCHELGHVIAMWGDRAREEDHHAWAHYTGCVIVDHASARKDAPPWLEGLRDARWRSVESLRKEAGEAKPSLGSREGVTALLLAVHDAAGPRALGDALNLLDAADRNLRVNRVRYYAFADLREALGKVVKDAAARKAVEAAFRP